MSPGRLASVVREHGDLVLRILLAIVQIVAIGWFSPGRGLPLDDAWIHQVVGRTFADTGTLGYAPGEHGAAATSYLWAALLALGFKFHFLEPTRWALLLNGLAALTTGQLLHSIVLRARPKDIDPLAWRATSFATTLLASIGPNILWLTCSGMEAMPFVALSLTAIWAATGDDEKPRRAWIAGIAAGALALLRPEAAPLGGLLAAHACIRKRTRSIAPIAVPWTACVAIYVGSNVVKTGHALPSTLAGRRWLWFEMSSGLSRSDRALDFLDAWTTRLGSYTFDTSPAVVWILVALAAYGALRLVRGTGVRLRAISSGPISEDAPRLLFGWALFHAAFYAMLLPTPGHGGRYQPLTPLLFAACLPIGTAFVLRELAGIAGAAEKVRFAWFAAIGIAPWIVLAAPIAGSLRNANALAVAHIQATEIGAGTFIDTLPEGTVASFDIGGSGYATRRRVLDLGGLSDPKTAALLEAGRISTWLAANQVRWLVLPQSYESALPTFEDYRTRLHLAENASLSLRPIHVFETPFDKWEPSIRATWNAAPKQVVYEVDYTSARGPREVGAVAPDARRPIDDSARLVPARERVVAEHMLATLAAWDLPVDVKLAPSAPASAAATSSAGLALDLASDAPRSARSSCAITIGWWGIAVESCTSVGDQQVLRAVAYELAGRYLDVGDLGGALRAIPHVVAQVRRRTDPGFHPPLAPLMQPLPGGVFISPARAGGYGLLLFTAVFVAALGIEAASKRSARVGRLVGLVRSRLPMTALVVIATFGCTQDNDVTRAITHGRGAVEIAIANGGSVDHGSRRPPILEAAAAGDPEIVALLVARGARLDVRDPGGATPLHLAARRGSAGAVAVLAAALTANASASERLDIPAGPRRRTALHDAVLSGSVDAVAALLRAGADPNKADSFEQRPLHLLATVEPFRAAAIASLLVQAGADPLLADARGFTPLHASAVSDNVPLVSTLAVRSYLVDAKTPAGETALDVALRYGRDRAAETLLSFGANVARDDLLPPLHQAARMDAIERAATLVASGADTRRLVFGKSALDLAVEHGSKRVEALLRERAR
jgi:ankyrin repeat protein